MACNNALTPSDPSNASINGHTVTTAFETGMLGLKGDWSSTSRFVRVATIIRYSAALKTAIDGVLAATQILNSVNIPPGLVQSNLNKEPVSVTTQWSTIKDLTNKIFYYRNSDGALRFVNLTELDFSAGSLHTPFSVQTPPFTLNMTHQLDSNAIRI